MSRNVRDMQREAARQTRYRVSIWDNGDGEGFGHWHEVYDGFYSSSRCKPALREFFLEHAEELDLDHGLYKISSGSYHAELQFTGGRAAA